MTISEEQYEDIRGEFDAHDVFDLRDYAGAASIPDLRSILDKLHDYAKKALDYDYNDETHEALEELSEEVDSLRAIIFDATEALDNIDTFLSKAENKLQETMYSEDED